MTDDASRYPLTHAITSEISEVISKALSDHFGKNYQVTIRSVDLNPTIGQAAFEGVGLNLIAFYSPERKLYASPDYAELVDEPEPTSEADRSA